MKSCRRCPRLLRMVVVWAAALANGWSVDRKLAARIDKILEHVDNTVLPASATYQRRLHENSLEPLRRRGNLLLLAPLVRTVEPYGRLTACLHVSGCPSEGEQHVVERSLCQVGRLVQARGRHLALLHAGHRHHHIPRAHGPEGWRRLRHIHHHGPLGAVVPRTLVAE